MAAASHKHTNRLASSSSPYLLQHAHNPVNWYPWGPEAFERARKEDKPIFLSVGYSTCYWCHVMERQSFENEQIAKEMNDRFVNIKVDREERPDVDQLYMTAVQVLTRHGGWPMSVFLTPDLKPFYGGTYFPPTDAQGRPGFVTVLRAIEDAYRNRKSDVAQSSQQLVRILQQLAEPASPEAPINIDDEFLDKMIDRSVSDFEPHFGGFGSAPKFPRQTLLELLLTYTSTMSGNPKVDTTRHSEQRLRVMSMLRHTLDALAHGGIRDHLGGGFHRYSTDAKWLVPHFEIMLYDNAMLGWVYVEAYRQTEDMFYAGVARGIFDFVVREMTSPQGGFYTALDAEVDGQEGLNYLWTADEIETILGKSDAKIFDRVYGVDKGTNFADPHHGSGTPDKNILYLAQMRDRDDSQSSMDEKLESQLSLMRQKLYAARQKRKQPLLDTKIITSWNALMIRALAFGGKHLQEQRYIDAAAKAADFVLRHHRSPNGGLIRTSGGGSTRASTADSASDQATATSSIPAFLDDYAFLIQALIELRDASGREAWKDHAAALAIAMIDRFGDDAGGFYFTERNATDLIVRQKTGLDSPLPSGNAVAAMALLRLDQTEPARKTLEVFSQQMLQNGEGMSSMVQLALQYVRREGELEIAAASQPGQKRPASPEQIAGAVVALRAAWDATSQLRIHVNILDGFHINAHEPSPGMIATQLSITSGEQVKVEAIEYPLGEEQQFAYADRPIRVYSGEIVILVRFKQHQPGGKPLRLSLQYQACDDNACLPPVTKQIDVAYL